MLGVEALEQVVAGGDRQLVALADVAQVELADELDRVARRRPRARAPPAPALLELREARLDLGLVELVERGASP